MQYISIDSWRTTCNATIMHFINALLPHMLCCWAGISAHGQVALRPETRRITDVTAQRTSMPTLEGRERVVVAHSSDAGVFIKVTGRIYKRFKGLCETKMPSAPAFEEAKREMLEGLARADKIARTMRKDTKDARVARNVALFLLVASLFVAAILLHRTKAAREHAGYSIIPFRSSQSHSGIVSSVGVRNSSAETTGLL